MSSQVPLTFPNHGNTVLPLDSKTGFEWFPTYDGNFHPWDRWDIATILGMVLTFSLVRYLTQSVIQMTLSRAHYLKVEPYNRKKFSESFWKLCYAAAAWTWSIFVVFKQDFFWDTRLTYVDNDKAMDLSFRLYFLFQFSFYLHSLVAHVTFEVRRGDWTQMLIHHVATVILVGCSYGGGYCRIGGVLLFLFDFNDMLLEGGKMLLYAGYQKTSDRLFFVLILTWISNRLVLYSTKVIYSGIFESKAAIGDFRGYIPLNILLLALLALNVYWFYLMMRMLFRVIIKKEILHDSREAEKHD